MAINQGVQNVRSVNIKCGFKKMSVQIIFRCIIKLSEFLHELKKYNFLTWFPHPLTKICFCLTEIYFCPIFKYTKWTFWHIGGGDALLSCWAWIFQFYIIFFSICFDNQIVLLMYFVILPEREKLDKMSIYGENVEELN